MAIIILAFTIYLVYVSYCKIVCLLFRGKQHNRFFGTFLSTVAPVVGSLPVIIIASKYERRVGGLASRMNEEILRYCTIALQLVSAFILFLPFLSAEEGYSTGINFIYGDSIVGTDVIRPSVYMMYLVVTPFLGAILNIADRKYNFRNVISYWISLILCFSMLGLFVLTGVDGVTTTIVFWVYCFVNVTIMLLSIFSLVVVRNRQLLNIETEEKYEYIKSQKEKNKPISKPDIDEDSYRCAKCGNSVKKGEICQCVSSHKTLDTLMKQSDDEALKFCVYCRRPLAEGETCNCQGNGFAITVDSHPYIGRKCKYCGQQLIGESICVCEKIINNSEPVDDSPLPNFSVDSQPNYSSDDVSSELIELEKKINRKFSDIKNTVGTDSQNQD